MLDPSVEAGILIVAANAGFWVLVAIRVRASQQLRSAPPYASVPAHPVVVAPHAARAVAATTVSMSAYYVLVVAWVLRPELAGAQLVSPSTGLLVLGGAVTAVALAMTAWAMAALRSWRLRAEIDADHELATKGPYGIVRHPIYSAVILLFAGLLIVTPAVGFLVTGLLNAAAYAYRARVEEQTLHEAFGETYRDYAQRTPAFIPHPIRSSRPTRPGATQAG